jgi:hypothetical protein
MARPKTEASADIPQLVRGRGRSPQNSREDLRAFKSDPETWYQQKMFHHNSILCIPIGCDEFLAHSDNEAGLHNLRQSFEVTAFDSGNETHLGLGTLDFANPPLPGGLKKFIRLSHISMCLDLSQRLSEGQWQKDIMEDLDETARALTNSSTNLKNLIMKTDTKHYFLMGLYSIILV